MPTRPEDLTVGTGGAAALSSGLGLVLLAGLGWLLLSGSRCSRIKKRHLQALKAGDTINADSARYEAEHASCDWAVDIERQREMDRYLAAHKAQPALGMAETLAPEVGEKKCNCKIVQIKSKGGSKRWAAKCAGSKLSRFVDKEFAKTHRGKTFCVKLLRPFNTLTGRAMAFRMWAKQRRKACPVVGFGRRGV